MKRTGTVIAGMLAVLVAGTLDRPIKAEQDKSAEVMASTRQAIGGTTLDQLKTFSVQARIQRNVGNMQMTSDTELLLEMPDKYFRSDSVSGGPIAMTSAMGFNGDRSLARMDVPGMAGGAGGPVIRMVGPGGVTMNSNEKVTPEQQEQMNTAAVRGARLDISRLMLGWFGMAHPALDVQYTYVGEAESPDGRAHVIDVTNGDGFAARLFVDQHTNLPLMLTYQGPKPRVMTTTTRAGGGAVDGGGHVQTRRGENVSPEDRQKMLDEIEKMRAQPPETAEHALFFDDWREVDGIKFPHSVQRAVEGTTNEEWTFSRVRVNPTIDAKKFEPQNEKM